MGFIPIKGLRPKVCKTIKCSLDKNIKNIVFFVSIAENPVLMDLLKKPICYTLLITAKVYHICPVTCGHLRVTKL